MLKLFSKHDIQEQFAVETIQPSSTEYVDVFQTSQIRKRQKTRYEVSIFKIILDYTPISNRNFLLFGI